MSELVLYYRFFSTNALCGFEGSTSGQLRSYNLILVTAGLHL